MTATFHVGDAIEVMNKLPEKSVDLILTSPPFLALRSYLPADHPDKALEGGSQATPGEYIDWLIDVVEACDRVLAPHGSMAIELGDTYAGSGGAGGDYAENGLREGQPTFRANHERGWPLAKSLSLIPELFRFTLVYGTNPLTGRTTERWRLRNVVRWVRPNPPVGALGDKFRPATSELMVFCKSAKRYFDLDAVREPLTRPEFTKFAPSVNAVGPGRVEDGVPRHSRGSIAAGAPPLDWWKIPVEEGDRLLSLIAKAIGEDFLYPDPHNEGNWMGPGVNASREVARKVLDVLRGRNPAPPLDWWNIPPGGFSGAHYAVWPPELLIKPIKAMCPSRVCRQCGEPSRRITETARVRLHDGAINPPRVAPTRNDSEGGTTAIGIRHGMGVVTLSEEWSDCGHRCPSCGGNGLVNLTLDAPGIQIGQFCDTCGGTGSNWRPGLVLDPFGGSGTTALVATGHGRDCILIDLDERNFDLALQRVGPFILERAS